MIPNPEEWHVYFAKRKKTAINLIIAKIMVNKKSYVKKKALKKIKKALKKDAEMIELANEAYKKYEKTIKKKI